MSNIVDKIRELISYEAGYDAENYKGLKIDAEQLMRFVEEYKPTLRDVLSDEERMLTLSCYHNALHDCHPDQKPKIENLIKKLEE